MSATPSLGTKTVRGLGWLTGAQGIRQLLQFGTRVLLVRLLAPEDFGLLAMVGVFTGFLLMFHDFGFGPALVRQGAVSEVELSTVFWLNAATGVLLALVTAAVGPLVGLFYGQPALVSICAALAIGSLTAPLACVPNALLQRRLGFRSLARIDLTGVLAGGAVGVTLAATGHGVWSLVWQSNVTLLVTLAAALGEARWRPQARFNPAAAAGLWKIGGRFTAASAVNYGVRSLDNLLIGYFLGATALGYYTQAYQLMLYPVQHIAALAGRVMFPALSSVQTDRERMGRAYLRALRGITAVSAPLMLGGIVLAPDLYAVLYGPRWERSVFIFQVLSGLGLLQSIGTTVGWIYLATGRTDLMLRWTLAAAGVIVPGFLIGLWWGDVEGLAVSYVASSSLLFLFSLGPAFHLVGLTLREANRRLGPLLMAAAGMAAGSAVVRWLLLPTLGPLPRLLLCLIFSLAAYATLLHALRQAPVSRARFMWESLRG